MKKTLLILTTNLLLSTSTLAAVDTFYLRGDVSANKNTTENAKLPSNIALGNLSFKGKTFLGLEAGFGYNVSEEFRAELVFVHNISPKMTGTYYRSQANGTFNVNSRTKARIEALMIKLYFDIYDFGPGKIFFGAGGGVSQVSEKTSWTRTTFTRSTNTTNTTKGEKKESKRNNFAYTLALGTSFKVKEGIDIDLQYSWFDYGHAKLENYVSPLKHRGNSIKAGIRFAL
jgi:opacity protein-like surface antigen